MAREEQLEKILQALSLRQKCALLSGKTAFGSRDFKRQGIPELIFSDGPHGLRRQAEGANHLGIGGSLPATCFPTAVNLAQSWNVSLLERVGAALGEEARAQRVNVVLGPGVCIKRNPLCGRNFEYFSEDPYAAGKLGAALVRGIQSKGVAACPKHFAANSQETRRQASNSVVDERALHEIYLEAFEIIVKEAVPKSLMTSYNLINGEYANDSQYLLDDILRKSWGFSGAVVTDWGGSNDHVQGVIAGSNFEMPAPGIDSVNELLAALNEGRLSEDVLNTRVKEALGLILDTIIESSETKEFDQEAHHQLAKEAAAESIVLLKNKEQVLPLTAVQKVALLGDFAQNPRYQGAGSSLVNSTKLQSLRELFEASGFNYLGFAPAFDRYGSKNEAKAVEALDLAKKAGVVVLHIGLSEAAESEGLDRSHIQLDEVQLDLIDKLSQLDAKLVVLLSAGSVVDTSWADKADAIVYLGLAGQAGAEAAFDILCGHINPSGKLSESWPKQLSDCPSSAYYPSDSFNALYKESIYVGYRAYDTLETELAFPFGFGLSYSDFVYSDPSFDEASKTLRFSLQNVSEIAGAEVVQLYVAKAKAKVFRPRHELKAFVKVQLQPGEKKQVEIALDDYAFRYYNVKTGEFEIEKGLYHLELASNSRDIRLSYPLMVEGTDAPDPYEDVEISAYRAAELGRITDADFERLCGRKLEAERIVLDKNFCLRDGLKSYSPMFWLLAVALKAASAKQDAHGRPNLNALFVYNMPLRALQKNAGQFINGAMVADLVRELKGWGLVGTLICVLLGLYFGQLPLALLCAFVWTFGPLLFHFVLNQIENRKGEAALARDEKDGELVEL